MKQQWWFDLLIISYNILVGGSNPFEKYKPTWESSPNRGEQKKNIFETTSQYPSFTDWAFDKVFTAMNSNDPDGIPVVGNDEDLDTISKMWTYYAQTTQVMMGCLPTFTMKINQIMGKYTLHGWYGILSLWQYVYPQFTIVYRHILKLCLLATHVLPLFMAGQPTPP